MIFESKEHFLNNRTISHDKYQLIMRSSLAEKLDNCIIKNLINYAHTELCIVLSNDDTYKGRMICRNGRVKFL